MNLSNDAQYMPFHVSKYLADTAFLSTQAHGAYLLLIMNYWQRGKPLDADDRKLAAIARLTPVEWSLIRDDIECFFHVENGIWTHDKVEFELARVKGKIEAARCAGNKSAAAKKAAKSDTYQQPSNGGSTDVEQMSNHKVRLGNIRVGKEEKERKKETRASAFTIEFKEFWEAYPKKVDKGYAEKAFEKAVKIAPFAEIMAGLESYKNHVDPKFIKNPATFLGGLTWQNDYGGQIGNADLASKHPGGVRMIGDPYQNQRWMQRYVDHTLTETEIVRQLPV